MLDEAMLPVLAGQVPPEWAGNIYCQLMAVCHDLNDVPRARHWTAATQRWCDSFASAVMFVGVCRMHRVQLLQIGGQWREAEIEASLARCELAEMNLAVVAEAHYQLAELHMLAHDLAAAEHGYRRAKDFGRDPQPGLALLRAAQGRTDEAAADLEICLADNAHSPFRRARLLNAYVEIALADGDISAAARACDELGEIAVRYATSGFITWADHARGALLLAQGLPEQALVVLRDAHRRYCEIPAPYEAAGVRVLMSQAHGQRGDGQASAVELDAAIRTYHELGAKLRIRQLGALGKQAWLPGGLTAREAEVLAQIMAGATNKPTRTV